MKNLLNKLDTNKTVKKLTEAMFELMKKQPFEKIHVNDICTLSGVHRTTFYKYFRDKYELLDLCLKSIEQILYYNKDSHNNLNNYKEYYMEATKKILEILDENKELFKTVFRQNKDATIIQNVISKFEQDVVDELMGRADLTNRIKDINIPPELFAAFYAGGCMAAAKWWFYDNDSNLTPQEMVSHLEKMIVTPEKDYSQTT